MREQPNDPGHTQVLQTAQPALTDNSAVNSGRNLQQIASSSQEIVSMARGLTNCPAEDQNTSHSSILNNQEVSALKFPELLKYLNTLSEMDQRKTVELICRLKTPKLKPVEETNNKMSPNVGNNIEIKPIDFSTLHQKLSENSKNLKDIEPIMGDQKESDTCQSKNTASHIGKTDSRTEDSVQEEYNSKWRQHLADAINMQNTSGDIKHSLPQSLIAPRSEQKMDVEKQSTKYELLDLIRKTCSIQEIEIPQEDSTKNQTLPPRGITDQMINVEQEVETCTPVSDGNTVNTETEVNISSGSLSSPTEVDNLQNVKSSNDTQQQRTFGQLGSQHKPSREAPMNLKGVNFQEGTNSQMSLQRILDSSGPELSVVQSSDAPMNVTISNLVMETSVVQSSPVFATSFLNNSIIPTQDIEGHVVPSYSSQLLVPQSYHSVSTLGSNQISSDNVLLKTQGEIGLQTTEYRSHA